MKNAVRNTTDEVHKNPLAALFQMGLPGAIERSEAAGQRELLVSDVLPVDAHGDDEKMVALGFTFGAVVEGDPIFRAATLPDGWKREGSDHAMWSYIVDERGIKRVGIFYKAAFYDRNASMHLINVGGEIGSNALYADNDPTAESLRLAVLTPAELADLRQSLTAMQQRIDETPAIYGKYAARLAACTALLG